MPALVKKFILAKNKNRKFVEVWGSGKVRREFLNVEDLAGAIYFILKKKVNYDYLNIGGGQDISIKELAYLIKKITNFPGKVYFNKKYPDGVKKRIVNSSKIRKLGWRPQINLEKGLKKYCDYYLQKILPLEKKL